MKLCEDDTVSGDRVGLAVGDDGEISLAICTCTLGTGTDGDVKRWGGEACTECSGTELLVLVGAVSMFMNEGGSILPLFLSCSCSDPPS